MSWKLAAVFLYALTIPTLLPNDDRYGKNRQRNIDYLSPKEKLAFNETRTIDSNLIRAKSHLHFFEACLKDNIRPCNLEYNGNFNVAFADNSVNEKLKAVDDHNILEKISVFL